MGILLTMGQLYPMYLFFLRSLDPAALVFGRQVGLTNFSIERGWGRFVILGKWVVFTFKSKFSKLGLG